MGRLPRTNHSLCVLLFEALILLAVPRLYIRARSENDADRAMQLVGQSRLVEARKLLHQILVFAPESYWKGSSLPQFAANIDQVVSNFEALVIVPLHEDATDDERFGRAKILAILGRHSDALAVLASSPTLADSAPAGNLRGTIHETQNRSRTARQWYATAKAAWEPQIDSPSRTDGLIQATTGVAYCERKLGHLREAEAAWLELLSLSSDRRLPLPPRPVLRRHSASHQGPLPRSASHPTRPRSLSGARRPADE